MVYLSLLKLYLLAIFPKIESFANNFIEILDFMKNFVFRIKFDVILKEISGSSSLYVKKTMKNPQVPEAKSEKSVMHSHKVGIIIPLIY